jgi:peptide methionine sulfoxide reductase msrA/msrB
MKNYIDKTASLTPEAKNIICNKATEYPHTGAFNTVLTQGTYLCRRCGLALFRAHSQFHSSCGWPSFDADLEQTVKEQPDLDGRRTEIVCKRCDAHLGHIFTGELLTKNNVRYCVNSASLDYVKNEQVMDTEEAIIAGGCFWGVDHFLKLLPGVLKVEVGYTGGILAYPNYDAVCMGNTGHYEAARVIFDTAKTDYHSVIKRFFEIHDPTQLSGQGPDLGAQYKSAVFCYNEEQKKEVEDLLQQLKNKKFAPATKILSVSPFWPAEEYHQDYYAKQGKTPYCHHFVSRFD